MTLQFGPAVEGGEIVNTCCNQVHGWMTLQGWRQPVYLHLTGNASPSLAGRRLTFQAAASRTADDCLQSPLARQQIGPAGDMALAGRQLLLEWYGQNGHVRCQLPAVSADCSPVVSPAALQQSAPAQADGGGLFRLLAPSLSQLAGQAAPVIDPDDWEQRFRLLDEVLDVTQEVPLGSLLDPPLVLPPADQLEPEALRLKFKELLARLALLGVSLDMCQHLTQETAYTLVRDRMLWQEMAHPQMAAAGYITHYLTFEHCPQCVAEEQLWLEEAEREEELERQEQEQER